MSLAPPPELSLPDARLRCWTPADEPALGAALRAGEAQLRRWTPWVIDGRVPGMSLAERLAEHARRFAAGEEWLYGIFALDGSAVLGGCGLYPRVGPGAVEIGYWLTAGATGRGLATRATETLVAVAFGASGIERVEIRCDPRNVASARIPARLGFTCAPTAGDDGDGLQRWTLRREQRPSSTG